MNMQINNNIPTIILIVFFSAILVYLVRYGLGYIVRIRKNKSELQEPPLKTVTVVSCINQDYTLEREFREGDFIGKVDGPCPKCNSSTVVERIYVVPLAVRETGRKR
ncbi:MAG: hypothetical protein N3D82_05310 [Ignisphaera sp.]|nr:hypothetical protein [Ignisphaera sp.]MCX8168426.1 hypothetical protein [Ignisphaera sp.]MDW8086061.1 hypothetical protein [Ignisphaera sp.]